MNGKSNLVVLAGGGLLVANVLFDPTFNTLRSSVSNGSLTQADATSSPVKMVIVGLLTLVALTVVSDDSDTAANTILIALACLWLLWLMSYSDDKAAAGKAAKK